MNIQDLQQKLDPYIKNDILTLPANNNLGSTDIGNLIETFLPGNQLVLYISDEPPPADTLIIKGTSALFQQSNQPSLNFRAQAEFRIVSDVPELALTFYMDDNNPGDWRFSDTFTSLSGTAFDSVKINQPQFILDSNGADQWSQQRDLQTGLNFSGQLVTDPTWNVSWLLNDSQLNLTGLLTLTSQAPVMMLSAPISNPPPIGPFEVSLSVQLQSMYDSVSQALITAVQLHSDLQITTSDNRFPISLLLLPDSEGLLTFDIDEEITIGDLSELAGLAKGLSLEGLIPPDVPLKGTLSVSRLVFVLAPVFSQLVSIEVGVRVQGNWQFTSDIEMTEFDIVFSIGDPLNPSLDNTSASIAALFDVGSENVDISVAIPDLILSATLTDDTFIDVGDLLAKFKINIGDLKEDIRIYDLSLVADFHAQTYHFYARCIDDWTVDLVITTLTLESVIVDVDYSPSSGVGLNLAAEINIGGKDFLISATKAAGESSWTVSFELYPGEVINLADFINDMNFGFGLDDSISSLGIETLAISYTTGNQNFTIQGQTAGPWVITAGSEQFSVSASLQISSQKDGTGKRIYPGSIDAQVDFGGTFDVHYVFGPTTEVITGKWTANQKEQSLSYSDVSSSLSIDSDVPEPPGGMPDFGIVEADLTIDLTNKIFSLDATTANNESAFFAIAYSQTDGQWEFAFGVGMLGGWKFSDLPGELGKDLEFFDNLTFTEACFVITTMTGSLPASVNFPPLNNQPLQLVPGLNFSASLDLTTGGDYSSVIKAVGGMDTLYIQGAIGATLSNTYLEASMKGPPITLPGTNNLALQQPKVIVHPEPTMIAIECTALVPVKGDQVTFEGQLLIAIEPTQSLTFLINADFEKPGLPNPVGFSGITLDEIGLSIGVTMEPLAVSVGMEAQFQIGDEPPGSDEFAFNFDVLEEAVDPVFLYCKFAQLDLIHIFNACISPDINYPPELDDITVTDFFIYWCGSPQAVPLPDGSLAQPGFGFNGNFTLFQQWNALIALMIDQAHGISGDAEMSPITVTRSGATFVSITGASRYGGPMITVNTKGPTYLSLSMDVTLLGFAGADVTGSVAQSGFSFSLHYYLQGVFDTNITCALVDDKSFNGSADFSFQIDLSIQATVVDGVTIIPAVDIDTSMHLTFNIQVNPGFSFSAHCDFDWDADGSTLSFDESFSLDMHTLSLAEDGLRQAIKDYFADEPKILFQDLLTHVSQWADAVVNGFFPIADDIGKILGTGFNLTKADALEIAKIMDKLGFGAEKIFDELVNYFRVGADEAQQIIDQIFGSACAVTSMARILGAPQSDVDSWQKVKQDLETRGFGKGQEYIRCYNKWSPTISSILNTSTSVKDAIQKYNGNQLWDEIVAAINTGSPLPNGDVAQTDMVQIIGAIMDAIPSEQQDDFESDYNKVLPDMLNVVANAITYEQFIDSLNGSLDDPTCCQPAAKAKRTRKKKVR